MSNSKKGWEIVEKALKSDAVALNNFRNFLKKHPQFNLDALFEEVDQTDYSLPDWVEALLEFERWMEQEGASSRPFRSILGYIHCCTQINPPTVSLASLKVIVSESLTGFGFDAKDASHL